MSRSKIAPRLREIVDDLKGHPYFRESDYKVCGRELRALLACARLLPLLAQNLEETADSEESYGWHKSAAWNRRQAEKVRRALRRLSPSPAKPGARDKG